MDGSAFPGLHFEQFSSCTKQCVISILDQLNLSNTTSSVASARLCADIKSMQRIYHCFRINCNYLEQAESWLFQKSTCLDYPLLSKVDYLRRVKFTLTPLAAIFVTLRCYSRIKIVKRFWWDDWVVLMATILLVICSAVDIWMIAIGYGLHSWNVKVENMETIIKIFYVMELCYILIQVKLKVSILLFYLRCFPVEWVRKTTWIFITFILAHGIVFFFLVVFQCSPVALLWDKRLSGECMAFKDIVFPGAILAIIEDLAILALPIPSLSTLNVGRGKRISMIIIFSVGIVACITSVVRLKTVLDYVDQGDESWDSVELLSWSEIELTVATICVCLPSIKSILNQHIPRFFSSGPADQNNNAMPKPENEQINPAKLLASRRKKQTNITDTYWTINNEGSGWRSSQTDMGSSRTAEFDIQENQEESEV